MFEKSKVINTWNFHLLSQLTTWTLTSHFIKRKCKRYYPPPFNRRKHQWHKFVNSTKLKIHGSDTSSADTSSVRESTPQPRRVECRVECRVESTRDTLGWGECRSNIGLEGTLSGDIQGLSELQTLYVLHELHPFLIHKQLLLFAPPSTFFLSLYRFPEIGVAN